jgi:hypothetical protein
MSLHVDFPGFRMTKGGGGERNGYAEASQLSVVHILSLLLLKALLHLSTCETMSAVGYCDAPVSWQRVLECTWSACGAPMECTWGPHGVHVDLQHSMARPCRTKITIHFLVATNMPSTSYMER